jgi:hypothetical protein
MMINTTSMVYSLLVDGQHKAVRVIDEVLHTSTDGKQVRFKPIVLGAFTVQLIVVLDIRDELLHCLTVLLLGRERGAGW